MEGLVVPIILFVIMIFFGVFFIFTTKKQEGEIANKSKSKNSNRNDKNNKNVKKDDVFNFLEFDKIQDDMIVQKNGTKYSMVIKCKGINYDLMSEIEQLAVEEGFITFLNTLRYPIQLYTQAQNIDLRKSVSMYNERIDKIKEEYDKVDTEYNFLVNDLEVTDEELNKAKLEKSSIQNVYEYGKDIVKYVERLSYNKSLLQRNFYVIVSYYSSEITGVSGFSKNEILDICYNELYTRAISIISGLSTCSVASDIMKSNEIAELLYNSYNRDDKNIINIQQSLESGYYRLYTTSEDAITKKNKMLEEQINNEAEIKAYSSIINAIEEGKYVTEEQEQDEINKEISKTAIDIIKNERIGEDIKENAKKKIVEEYKQTKKSLMEKSKEKESQIYDIAKENLENIQKKQK